MEGPHVDALFEPDGVEIETKRCPVGREVATEIAHEHFVGLVVGSIGRARINHSTRVLFDLELVHDHLPDAREAAARAALTVTNTSVRNSVIQRVRPDGWVTGGCRHRRVVDEAELFHHKELTVPADAQEGYADTTNLFHAHTGEFVDDVSLAHHLVEPVLNGSIG